MKILIICSGNAPNFKFDVHHAFVYDQVNAIAKSYTEISFDYFFINGKGIKGYLSNFKKFKRQIKAQNFDIIHAHFGFSGLLANLQRKVPVVCSFHGSDINVLKHRILSSVVEILSKKTIYVSEMLYSKAIIKKGRNIIPCGVDLEIFRPIDKDLARQRMNLDLTKHYILFSSSFNNKVKNYKLLKEAHTFLGDKNLEILELKGYTREEVAHLINAADICVMTSLNEGSPQFVKEAMACNCPIVSTNVGDVKKVFGNSDGCFITTYELDDVIVKIKLALDFADLVEKTKGRNRIMELGLISENVAKQVVEVYRKALSKEN